MGKIVERINTPGISGPVMFRMTDAVEERIAHVHVLMSQVDLGSQHMGPIGKFSAAHPVEEIEVLGDSTIAIGARRAGFGQRSTQPTNFFR